MEKQVELDIERSSRYCCLAHYVTHHPVKVYLIAFLSLLITVVLTIVFELATLSEISGRDYLVDGSDRVYGLNVETLVGEELDKASDGSQIVVRVQFHPSWYTVVAYDC